MISGIVGDALHCKELWCFAAKCRKIGERKMILLLFVRHSSGDATIVLHCTVICYLDVFYKTHNPSFETRSGELIE
jgi:hypothetical protein